MNSSTTLNEIAQNVLNAYRGGRSSNTEHVSLEQIKFAIKYYRATFIRRDQQRNFNRYRQFEQDLGLIEVELVDTSEDSSIPSNELIMRTASKIPEPIRLKNSEAITFVGCIDKFGQPFPLIDAHRAYWRQFDKYTSRESDAFYKDGYVYIRDEKDIENINIRGIFEDPEEVYNFIETSSLDPYDGERPFPIPSDMLEGITKGLLNGELKLLVTSQDDDEADLNQDDQ